mgnify:CR=1 FL=1
MKKYNKEQVIKELQTLLICYKDSKNKDNLLSLIRLITNKLEEYEIEGVRYQKEMVILKLKGINDRNEAEALKERDLYITEEDLRELPEDTFYVKDLIGCRVINEENGDEIGRIKDVLQNSAQDIYQIELKNGKEALIPVVGEFVREVNIEEKYVKIHLIPGFIDEEAVKVE